MADEHGRRKGCTDERAEILQRVNATVKNVAIQTPILRSVATWNAILDVAMLERLSGPSWKKA